MKYASLSLALFLALGLFMFTGCGDDDAAVTADTLNYDGPNVTAPQNGAGLNTFAAFFTTDQTQPFAGRRLERVRFWLTRIPLATSVVVYAEGNTDRSPGAELYRVNLTQRIRNTGWNEHVLTTPVDVEADRGLWLAVEVDIENNGDQAIGCDSGASYSPNGDRLLPSTGGVWTSFNEITGSETVNWNIRGVLADE